MIRLEAYATGTTPIVDPRDELRSASNPHFTTHYPGGIYGTLHAVISRRVTEWWDLQGAQRLVAREGLKIVWEGKIDNLRNGLTRSGESVEIAATGQWGIIAMRRRLNKPWADSRLSEAAWPEATSAYAASDITLKQNVTIDRLNRIRFTPKAIAFANNDYHRLVYTAPTGQTIKRATLNYDLQEASQQWRLALFNETAGVSDWSVTASGTGSVDQTLSTPSQKVWFLFQSQAAQTPASDGTIYGQVSNVVVYTETGSINLTEIAKDIRAAVTDINSSEIFIGSNTLSLVPFCTDGYDCIGDILLGAAGYGDASFNPWAVYFGHSELAPTLDGKPVMVVEQQPSIAAGHDYSIRFGEIDTSLGEISYEQNYDQIQNWIIVKYKDPSTGADLYVTPDDDANLKNATSITAYGERHSDPLEVDTTSQANAIQYGRRYLAQYKDPIIRMTSPIVVSGQIETSQNNRVPVSWVRAGQRLRITDFLGTDVVFLIASTEWENERLTIYAGDGGIII